jgi:NAD(P)-dependent dehydrogenase (short-subunit alcohol dehydrogenase family)
VTDQYTQQDPTTQYPQPNFGEQKLEHPGLEPEMQPNPDYGYETYRGSGRLDGKKAIITGGDSGIGRAVALAFAREGVDVLISYLEEEEPDAQETARVVEEAGRKAVRVPGDVREETHCQTIVQKAVDEFGRIDVLVNNAAYQMVQPGGIADITTEQFDRVLKTNLYAMFWLSKAAIPHMRPGASIINTTSIEAYQPEPGLLDYASTKGAIVERAGIVPEDAVVVGDSIWDIEAAKEAGVRAAAVMTGGAFSRAELEEAGVYAVYEDCAELLEAGFPEELNPTA